MTELQKARAALRKILATVEDYAATYDEEHVGLGAYEACSQVRKIVRRTLKIKEPTNG